MSVLHGTLFELLFNRLLLEKGLSVTMSSEVGFILECGNCLKEMGRISKEERDAVFSDLDDHLLCFDCEPDSADTTPNIFWQWQENESFEIDDLRFDIYQNKLICVGEAYARSHERT